jgi:hypothetical protein
MRRLAPALLLLIASCGQGDRGTNQVSRSGNIAGRGPGEALGANIVIAATGPGGCSASWDGQAVTPAQITERGTAVLERAIGAIGGPQNMTEHNLPVPNVEAPADLSIACADTILFALQSAGMFSVSLRPTGGQAPVLMDFPLDTHSPPPPVPMVLGIGAGGQVTWNGDPLDDAGLAARLGEHGSTTPSEPGEMEAPPGGLELRVRREANFGQLYELLRTARRYHLRPFVYLPSAGAGPSPVASPMPPMPAMPAMPPPTR